MPTSYTSLIGLALPVTGELSGTWGDTVNNYITNYLDSAVAGTQTISGSQTAVTLSVTNGSSLVTAGSGSTGSAQFQIINCTGNPAGLLTITAPASSRQYIIINATSTSQSVKIVGSGPTTGVTILSGEKAHVAWNGSDFVKIATQSGNGSFVDLTVSGSMTLSGGTANGVLYLNGSKVATSGSALTFDGTNLGLSGLGSRFINLGSTSTNGQSAALQISAPNSDASANVYRVGTGLTADNEWVVYDVTNTQVVDKYIRGSGGYRAFYQNGSEGMRLTSTGLGIGTSSPVAKLGVAGNVFISGASPYIAFDTTQSGSTPAFIQYASSSLIFGAGSTERMRLDSSGNLGLGVTPTNVASYTNLEVRGSTGGLFYTSNSNGSVKGYFGNTASVVFLNAITNHPLTFGTNDTERARITSGGALLVGTTTTTNNLRLDEKVAIVGVNVPYNGMALTGYTGAGGSAYRPVIDFNRSRGTTDGSMTVLANSDYLGSIIFRGSDGTSFQDSAMISSEVDGTPGANDMPGRLTFWTSPDGSTTVTERARITSGGDLLVGTVASSSARLYVRGSGTTSATASFEASNSSGATRFYVQDDGTTRFFGSSGSETARITGEGYLLVGTTAPSIDARLVVNNPDNVSGDFCFVTYLGSNCNNTSSYHYIVSTGGADKLYIYGNGNIVNTNNSYGTLSDAKMKTDIVDAGSQWADIKAVRFRKFKMKNDPTGLVQLGVVAQELEQTSPRLVDEHPDYEEVEITDEDGNVKKERQPTGTTTKSVKTSVLLMKAAVALQEAMARIEQLEAKVAALESKGV